MIQLWLYAYTGELGYDGPLYDRFLLMMDNAACSPLALHCGGKSYLGAQLDKEGGHLAKLK